MLGAALPVDPVAGGATIGLVTLVAYLLRFATEQVKLASHRIDTAYEARISQLEDERDREREQHDETRRLLEACWKKEHGIDFTRGAAEVTDAIDT